MWATRRMHERGTKGGIVLAYGLRPGTDAMPRLREYFRRLQGSATSPGYFTTEVRPGALRAGKTRAALLGCVAPLLDTADTQPKGATGRGLVRVALNRNSQPEARAASARASRHGWRATI